MTAGSLRAEDNQATIADVQLQHDVCAARNSMREGEIHSNKPSCNAMNFTMK
jgi:hypothetical protein